MKSLTSRFDAYDRKAEKNKPWFEPQWKWDRIVAYLALVLVSVLPVFWVPRLVGFRLAKGNEENTSSR